MLVESLNSIAKLGFMAEKQAKLQDWQVEDAARLLALWEAYPAKVSQLKFGADYGIGSQGMVWQYLNGHRPLNIAAAVAFARGLSCKVRDFSPTLADQIKDAWQLSGDARPDHASPIAANDDDLHGAVALLQLYEQLPRERRSTFLGMGQRLLIETGVVGLNVTANHKP